MNAGDIMVSAVITVKPDATVSGRANIVEALAGWTAPSTHVR
jgi:CBS domain-containing protein